MTTVRRPRPSQAGSPLALGALVLLTAVELVMIFTHVAWRDETQALVLAVKSPDLSALFRALHYEGHPALWYLTLRGLSIAAPGTLSLQVAQALISLSVIGLVYSRAPFSAWTRLLILTGYFFLFEYGVIARSYSLGALLFLVWLAFPRSSLRWLALGLMTQISVHFALLAVAAVGFETLQTRRPPLAGTCIVAIGLALSVATLWPTAGVFPGLSRQPGVWQNLIMALQWLSTAVIPVTFFHATWGEAPAGPMAPVLGLFFAPLGAAALWGPRRSDQVSTLCWLVLYGVILGFSALVYQAYARHVGVLVLWLVGLLWRRSEESGRQPGVVALTWLSLSAAAGLWMTVIALALPFSSADQAAQWLRRQGPRPAQLCVYPGWHAPDLTARLNQRVCDLKSTRLIWVEPWDRPPAPFEDQGQTRKLLERAARAFGPVLLIYADANNMTLEQSGAHRLKVFPEALQGGAMAVFAWRAPLSMHLEKPQERPGAK